MKIYIDIEKCHMVYLFIYFIYVALEIEPRGIFTSELHPQLYFILFFYFETGSH